MSLTISKSALAELLGRLSGVCARRSTLQILNSCLIEAGEDGVVTATGTDLEVTIRSQAQAKVQEPFGLCAPAKMLLNTVQAAAKENITLKPEDNYWLQVKAGRSKARIASSDPLEFPKIPEIFSNFPFEISAEVLFDMIDKVFFVVSTDTSRATFAGGFLQYDKETSTLSLVGTDGHRLVLVEQQLDAGHISFPFEEGIIIPRNGLAEIRKHFSKSGLLTLDTSANQLLVKQDELSLIVQLIPGRFPNVRRTIPEEFDFSFEVILNDLSSALKRASIYTPDSNTVNLGFKEKVLEVFAQYQEGEFSQEISYRLSGSGWLQNGGLLAFNIGYLKQALNIVESRSCAIQFIDGESPVRVVDPDRPNVLSIIMPCAA